MTIQSQVTRDLLVGFPLPRQRQNRLFHLMAACATLHGAHGDRDRGVRRVTSSPNDTASDLVRGAAAQNDLVDQAPQERLLLFLGKSLGTPQLGDLSPRRQERLPGLWIEIVEGRLLLLLSFPLLFCPLQLP